MKNKETPAPRRYTAVCRYFTECYTRIPVEAYSEEEAKQQAQEKFERWNDDWITKDHGNPKRLIEINVE